MVRAAWPLPTEPIMYSESVDARGAPSAGKTTWIANGPSTSGIGGSAAFSDGRFAAVGSAVAGRLGVATGAGVTGTGGTGRGRAQPMTTKNARATSRFMRSKVAISELLPAPVPRSYIRGPCKVTGRRSSRDAVQFLWSQQRFRIEVLYRLR